MINTVEGVGEIDAGEVVGTGDWGLAPLDSQSIPYQVRDKVGNDKIMGDATPPQYSFASLRMTVGGNEIYSPSPRIKYGAGS